MFEEQEQFDITNEYPLSQVFDYYTRLVRLNLDESRIHDLATGKGFIIKEPQDTNKDLKSEDSIYSSRFGRTLQDTDPYASQFKCECGHLQSREWSKAICPECGTPVKFIGEDYDYFGWCVINGPYYIIHPNLFKAIEFFFGVGKKSNPLMNIINYSIKANVNGYTNVEDHVTSADEPFSGIGLIAFKERFDEVMNFYLAKYPNKKEFYDMIMDEKDKVFTQSIPVYTTQLRPFKVSGDKFIFEDNNKEYNTIAASVARINNNKTRFSRNKKQKEKLLFDIQCRFNLIYSNIENILSGKRGIIRQIFGGRYNFTSRVVIHLNPTLKADEITLPYKALVVLLEQRIINLLKKSYNITYDDAYRIWYKSLTDYNDIVYEIIKTLIRKDTPRGLPILLNRNPTLTFGSIVQLFCIGITDNNPEVYAAGIPIEICPGMNADFDGDTLNVLLIINKDFLRYAYFKFNPANNMHISKNDGLVNPGTIRGKDTLVLTNSMIYLSRKKYTGNQLDKIKRMKEIGEELWKKKME